MRELVVLILISAVAVALASFFVAKQLVESTQRFTENRVDGGDIAGTIRSYIAAVEPDIRRRAVEILEKYLATNRTILWDVVKVYPGSWSIVTFEVYPSLVYEIRVKVLKTCQKESCDVVVLLKNAKWSTVRNLGRVADAEFSYTLSGATWREHHRLYLDNTYSNETKSVIVSISVRFPQSFMNNDVFKVHAISSWVNANIKYLSDPWGLEYVSSPTEVIEVGAGDCEDYAVLLATLYRSVGLKAAVGLVDTDGDEYAEHAATLVYLERDISSLELLLESISQVLGYRGIRYPYIKAEDNEQAVWVIVDPIMAIDPPKDWRIGHDYYSFILVIDP